MSISRRQWMLKGASVEAITPTPGEFQVLEAVAHGGGPRRGRE